MLHAVRKLSEHCIGNIVRRLRDEVHAHALRADKLDNLDDLIKQLLGHAVEQKMCLVKEEDEFRLVEITNLWKRLE